ncbi:MAG: PAS domain S-box protein [Bacteroidales bacterium]|nr:PAS domain S-box protein [Bacteroidales bacterium]
MEKVKFLLIEKDTDKVALIDQQLSKRFAYSLVSVVDEKTYVEQLKEYVPDFILANHYTPKTDGKRLVRWRNQIVPNVPFILLTEVVEDDLALEVIKEGASEYIAYEHIVRLAFKVQKLLEQRKLLRERDLAEDRLKKSYKRFQEFVEHDISGDYMEVDDKIVYCNKTVLDIFGFNSIEELNNFNQVNLYDDPEQREEVNSLLRSGKKVVNKELKMRTRTGKPLVIIENAYAELDANGEIKRIQGYLLDITELKNTEASLKESESLFRTLVESSNAGVVIYDQKSFLFSNSVFRKMVGYSEEELLKMHYWDVVHPEFVELTKRRGAERMAGGNPESHYQFKIVGKQGESRWIDFTAGSITFHGKSAAIGTIFDITKLKEAQEELNKFSIIVEQSPLSVMITDMDANIEYVNQAFIENSGYTIEELIGSNPRMLASGETPKEIYTELWKNLTTGIPWKGEFLNKKKSGKKYIDFANIFPVFDENGKIIHYTSIRRDITKEKETELQLSVERIKVEEANRLKTAILTNMSHELRTPLNGILGFSTLISELEDLNEIREMVGYINESGQRLLRTLNLIIDVSRLEAGNFNPKIEQLDLVVITELIINKFKESAQQKGLVLSFDPFEKKCIVESDLKFVTDTLENLLDNSIKYTNEGYIRISINHAERAGKKYKIISVKDTGIGISKENQKLIFEDFQQESVGYGRIYEGTGLGLSIARKYMDLLGGFIELNSEVGKGSEFTIYIPEETKSEK